MVHSNDELCSTNVLAVRNGFYDGLVIIDSCGNKYVVAHTGIAAPIAPLWGFRFLKPREVTVDLKLTHDEQLTLTEVQDIVVKNVKREPHTWEGRGEIPQLEVAIRSTGSIPALLALLS